MAQYFDEPYREKDGNKGTKTEENINRNRKEYDIFNKENGKMKKRVWRPSRVGSGSASATWTCLVAALERFAFYSHRFDQLPAAIHCSPPDPLISIIPSVLTFLALVAGRKPLNLAFDLLIALANLLSAGHQC